jgi:hypothetical protein
LTFFRKRQDQGLEDRLRDMGAEPQDEFVRELSNHVRENRLRTTVRSRRFVAALVTSGLMLIPFVAFGGVGYAAAAAKTAVQTVANNDSKKVEDKKPDDDQYKPGKGCGDKNHQHERENECKNPPK